MQQTAVNLPPFVGHTVSGQARELEGLAKVRSLYQARASQAVDRYALVGDRTARRLTLVERLARALKLTR